MKHLSITYHLTTDHSKPADNYPHNVEIAETCITIPMMEEIADDILKYQGDSKHVREGSLSITPIKTILEELARLQGYQEAHFCCAEHDNFWKEIEK